MLPRKPGTEKAASGQPQGFKSPQWSSPFPSAAGPLNPEKRSYCRVNEEWGKRGWVGGCQPQAVIRSARTKVRGSF